MCRARRAAIAAVRLVSGGRFGFLIGRLEF
jgi:hypothetical protein